MCISYLSTWLSHQDVYLGGLIALQEIERLLIFFVRTEKRGKISYLYLSFCQMYVYLGFLCAKAIITHFLEGVATK